VSRTALWIAIGAAAFVVVALAVLTPTVIVDDGHGGVRVVRAAAPAPAPGPAPAPAPFPFRQGFLPDLKRCLENHGFGGRERKLPTPDQLRAALRDCAPRLRR
jgi:hypothetical protein